MGRLQCGDNQRSGLVVALAGLMNEVSRHSISLWVDLPHCTLLLSLLHLVFISHTDGEICLVHSWSLVYKHILLKNSGTYYSILQKQHCIESLILKTFYPQPNTYYLNMG